MDNKTESNIEKGNTGQKIGQIIVVEGRDDTTAVKRAVNADTIETHGFGINRETWVLIERAYNERGIIIFTDPDHAGENIRKRVAEKFPGALHAYLDRKEARAGRDIGIENAQPAAIIAALEKAKPEFVGAEPIFTMDDLRQTGLTGQADSAEKRAAAGKALGIGTGNSKAFLRKLNSFRITKEEFYGSISEIAGPENKE